MPCHKLYLNLQWQARHELRNADVSTVTITKIYWTYQNKGINVCYLSTDPDFKELPKPRKHNVYFPPESGRFRALYEALAYHALDNPDPLLEELLSYMPTLIPSLANLFQLPTPPRLVPTPKSPASPNSLPPNLLSPQCSVLTPDLPYTQTSNHTNPLQKFSSVVQSRS